MPATRLPRLLVLDCDGVLVRSERANVAYYNHIFRSFGMPAVEPHQTESIHLLHTLSTPQVIEHFLAPERRGEAREFVGRLTFEPFLDDVEPEPGWGDVLDRWQRSGGRAAVATNRGESASAVLAAVGLLDRVDLVLTIRDVARPKPAPDLLCKAVEHFGLAPREALYVGDAELDQEAARRAGVPFLGFRRAGPPTADSPEDVERYLTSLASGESFATLLATSP